MKQHEGVCPFTSVIKEKTPKKKIALNQVGVLARHKLWQFFFRRTVSTTDIVLPCCYEKALQFSGEIWAAKVHSCSENLLAHFSAVSRVEVKKIAEIRASSLSCLVTLSLQCRFCAHSYSTRAYAPAWQKCNVFSWIFHWCLSSLKCRVYFSCFYTG